MSAKGIVQHAFPKLCATAEMEILQKLAKEKSRLANFHVKKGRSIYYSRKVGYFLQVLDFMPRVLDGSGNRRSPSEFKELCFENDVRAKLALCCLNSNLFYWFVTVFSDCRHLNRREVDAFPIDLERLAKMPEELVVLADELMEDVKVNSEDRHMKFKHDTLTVQCIVPKYSKPVIDKIDCALAAHYGFTDEELDFIINYDIKYRMGRESFGQGRED